MRVVSWEIHWRSGKDGRIRIHAIIDALRRRLNADVICLHEVAPATPHSTAAPARARFASWPAPSAATTRWISLTEVEVLSETAASDHQPILLVIA